MARILLKGLWKRYPTSDAVKGLDLEIPDGRFTVLLGPSGCGKTTTLRMIAGLVDPTTGEIHIGDRDVTKLEPKHRNVAMVFQNYALYPHLRVYENIAFGLRAQGTPGDELDRRVHWAAELLGLSKLLDRKPAQLSGGQRQRVAIGRALVREPAAFLFDEPLSNLDAKLRADMRTEIRRIQRDLGATVVYVTHDQEEAMALADEIVVMREGVIEQRGGPQEVYDRPRTEFVGTFIGSPTMNVIRGHLEGDRFVSEWLQADGREGVGSTGQEREVRLGVRPDNIHPSGSLSAEHATNPFEGLVELIEPLGARAIVSIRLKGELELRVVVDARNLKKLREGERMDFVMEREALHFFN